MAKKRKAYRRTFIREWRQHRRLTVQQLADMIDMTNDGLSMLERGQSGYTQQTLEAISEALNVDVSDLLSLNPAEHSSPLSDKLTG